MGTTWGDLSTWGDLDLWWIPNAVQAAGTLTVAGVAAAPSGTITGAASGLCAAESFAAGARIAVCYSGQVCELSAVAEAAVVTSPEGGAAAAAEFGAVASAVRVPPRDRPAGALIGSFVSTF